jgi:hypothetical protein
MTALTSVQAWYLVGLVITLGLALVTSKIAEGKGRNPIVFFVVGFLLPVIGLAIALFISPRDDASAEVGDSPTMVSPA